MRWTRRISVCTSEAVPTRRVNIASTRNRIEALMQDLLDQKPALQLRSRVILVDVAVRCGQHTTPSLISDWRRLRLFVSAWAAGASERARRRRTVFVEHGWRDYGHGRHGWGDIHLNLEILLLLLFLRLQLLRDLGRRRRTRHNRGDSRRRRGARRGLSRNERRHGARRGRSDRIELLRQGILNEHTCIEV
jgi:hypothetical protein